MTIGKVGNGGNYQDNHSLSTVDDVMRRLTTLTTEPISSEQWKEIKRVVELCIMGKSNTVTFSYKKDEETEQHLTLYKDESIIYEYYSRLILEYLGDKNETLAGIVAHLLVQCKKTALDSEITDMNEKDKRFLLHIVSIGQKDIKDIEEVMSNYRTYFDPVSKTILLHLLFPDRVFPLTGDYVVDFQKNLDKVMRNYEYKSEKTLTLSMRILWTLAPEQDHEAHCTALGQCIFEDKTCSTVLSLLNLSLTDLFGKEKKIHASLFFLAIGHSIHRNVRSNYPLISAFIEYTKKQFPEEDMGAIFLRFAEPILKTHVKDRLTCAVLFSLFKRVRDGIAINKEKGFYPEVRSLLSTITLLQFDEVKEEKRRASSKLFVALINKYGNNDLNDKKNYLNDKNLWLQCFKWAAKNLDVSAEGLRILMPFYSMHIEDNPLTKEVVHKFLDYFFEDNDSQAKWFVGLSEKFVSPSEQEKIKEIYLKNKPVTCTII